MCGLGCHKLLLDMGTTFLILGLTLIMVIRAIDVLAHSYNLGQDILYGQSSLTVRIVVFYLLVGYIHTDTTPEDASLEIMIVTTDHDRSTKLVND